MGCESVDEDSSQCIDPTSALFSVSGKILGHRRGNYRGSHYLQEWDTADSAEATEHSLDGLGVQLFQTSQTSLTSQTTTDADAVPPSVNMHYVYCPLGDGTVGFFEQAPIHTAPNIRAKGYTNTYILDTETHKMVQDPREGVPRLCAYAVCHGVLHIFSFTETDRESDCAHSTYTRERGWENVGPLPCHLVESAASFGRHICVFGDRGGLFVYDTISGDWAKVSEHCWRFSGTAPLGDRHVIAFHNHLYEEEREDEPERETWGDSLFDEEVHNAIPASPLTATGERETETRVDPTIPGCLFTLNDAMLYPSVEMGWGRLLEWDLDHKRSLGLEKGSERENDPRQERDRRLEREGEGEREIPLVFEW
ncbi:protein of unknown function DUF1677, Oryza sativa [Kipferlia bialata]|uniref:Uncharacterized protein n=1 Tax=Kipferlia bialata TaxID=797122 RepID=A0A9K3GNM5_9EUKA|nr:protein of unknown function DUF1677, Oryza sativa [Kipferlia bialata]|eukprot:g11287.t1